MGRSAKPLKPRPIKSKARRRIIRHPVIERGLLTGKRGSDWLVAKTLLGTLALARKLPAERATDLAERTGRRLALRLPRAKLARANMARAFPDRSEAELDEMVRGVWGNVARTIAEYVFLDQLFDFDVDDPDAGRVEVAGIPNFVKIRDGGRPAIIFTAHTGNWEILPIAAAAYDLNVTALFRTPNNPYLADYLLAARTTASGHLVPSRAGAAWALGRVLEKDGAVGVLVDQHFRKGVTVTFMGRPARGNPLVAKLARQYDCDIHPARCIRLPDGRFRLELEDAVEVPRRDGEVDVHALTQTLADVTERWVREYPEQWLWLHRRWRD